MSQAKVDKYKEQKANRKEIVKKERRARKISKAVAVLVLILILAGVGTGVGFTIRNQYIKAQNAKPDYSSNSLVAQDMAGILREETSEEESSGETEAAESSASDTTQAAE